MSFSFTAVCSSMVPMSATVIRPVLGPTRSPTATTISVTSPAAGECTTAESRISRVFCRVLEAWATAASWDCTTSAAEPAFTSL